MRPALGALLILAACGGPSKPAPDEPPGETSAATTCTFTPSETDDHAWTVTAPDVAIAYRGDASMNLALGSFGFVLQDKDEFDVVGAIGDLAAGGSPVVHQVGEEIVVEDDGIFSGLAFVRGDDNDVLCTFATPVGGDWKAALAVCTSLREGGDAPACARAPD